MQSAQSVTVAAAASQLEAREIDVPASQSVDEATQELGFVVDSALQKANPVALESARQAGQVAKVGPTAIAWHPTAVVARVPPQASVECTQRSGDEEQKPYPAPAKNEAHR